MIFRARAKNAGPCAYGPCRNQAKKIYHGEGYRYLACSQAHAELAEQELFTLTPAQREIVLKKP